MAGKLPIYGEWQIISSDFRLISVYVSDICVVKIVFPAYFQYHIANKIINFRRLTDLTKKCVYTAVSGGYDGVLQHDYVAEDYDYIFFTDNQKLLKKQKLGHWTVRPLAFSALDNVRNSRWHKTHPHVLFPDYEESIWVDGNVNIKTSYLFDLVRHSGKKLLVSRHGLRDCIYAECAAVARAGMDDFARVYAMREYLLDHGMPEHYGLNETNVIFRRHNEPEIVRMMDEWWGFIEKYSRRDQLSFSYVLFENGVKVDEVSFPNARNDIRNFEVGGHKVPFSFHFGVKHKKNKLKFDLCGLKISLKFMPDFSKSEKPKIPDVSPLTESGLNPEPRDVPLIVSLASFPERIGEVSQTVTTLLRQDLKPDKVILWLDPAEFPGGKSSLPAALLDLEAYGLEIAWGGALRSYNKLVPALEKYPEAVLVTADDDLLYPRDWLRRLYEAHLREPEAIVAHRAHLIKFENGMVYPYARWEKGFVSSEPRADLLPTTGGGVLYPPHSLYKDVTDAAKFKQIAPFADDLWFWGMAMLNGRKVVSLGPGVLCLINPEREFGKAKGFTLGQVNLDGNDLQMRRLMRAYPALEAVLA